MSQNTKNHDQVSEDLFTTQELMESKEEYQKSKDENEEREIQMSLDLDFERSEEINTEEITTETIVTETAATEDGLETEDEIQEEETEEIEIPETEEIEIPETEDLEEDLEVGDDDTEQLAEGKLHNQK